MKTSPPVELSKICQWLETAVVEVIETMFGSMAYAEGAPDLSQWQDPCIQAEISFAGAFSLKTRVWLRESCATELSSRVLHMPKQELNEQVVDDTVGEVSNMILGAVKSKVADRGFACSLSIPVVHRPAVVSGFGVPAERERFLVFHFGAGHLLLCVAIPD